MSQQNQSAADRGMNLALKGLNTLGGLGVIDRVGLRKPIEGLVYRGTRDGFRAAAAASRTFAAVTPNGNKPHRSKSGPRTDLFDLTPSDEQHMLREAFGDFGLEKLRPAAQGADTDCGAPEGLISAANELGATMLGVPTELGGAVDERSAVTTVLVAEALARGDAGLAVAILAPAGVATALAMWGDAAQQGTYLPALVGDDVPDAAIALLEPRPLFDPFKLETKAKATGDGGYVLNGVKSLVPLAKTGELFIVGADLEGKGPALFIVESGYGGIAVEPEPAMGIRAAATGTLTFNDVKLPAEALLGNGEADVYAELIQRGRLGWCAVAVGSAQAVLDYVIPYVKDRKAFGETIASRQAVAFSIADIGIELEAMRLLTWRAASLADADKDFAHAVALAQDLCARKGMDIGSAGVQLLGGHGYVKEHPVERWYRDLRAAGLMEGALLV